MSFVELTPTERMQVQALHDWRATRTRAELSRRMAEVRLEVNHDALASIGQDAWFGNQVLLLQNEYLLRLSSDHDLEFERKEQAEEWLRAAEPQIEALLKSLDPAAAGEGER